jgi:GntR family transcriptional regulator, vanillate catabolism transcriptional regulator
MEGLGSQQVRRQQEIATIRIREMILQGALGPGHRMAEAALAEELGLSRTPIRQALPALAEEGLLTNNGRGYVVKSFSFQDVINALDIRGALEGIAARAIAELGITSSLADELNSCLGEGDAIFQQSCLSPRDELIYSRMNEKFHRLIVDGANNSILRDTIARIEKIPFASVRAMVMHYGNLQRMTAILSYAHGQHHAIVDALKKGEGARVDALMCEHVAPVKQGLTLLKDSMIKRGESRSEIESSFAHLANLARKAREEEKVAS